MKKLLKILGIGIASIIVLLVIAVIAVTVLIDPNDYRDKITDMVKKETGRELVIKGDLSLSFFPWVGLSVGETTLSNARGFGKQPFAQFDNIQIRVQVMPLFSSRIVTDAIVLDGVELNLAKSSQGITNWQDLVTKSGQKKPEKSMPHDDSGQQHEMQIGGVQVKNTRLSWKDDQTGTHYVLEQLNLETGAMQPDKPVDIKLAFTIQDKKAGRSWQGGMKGTVDMDHVKHNMAVSNLQIKLADLTLSGRLDALHLHRSPLLKVVLKSNAFVPRELASDFGVSLPITADASVFGKAQLEMTMTITSRELRLSKYQIKLDDSTISGNVKVNNFSKPAIRYLVNIDDIDADRYMPPPAKTETKKETAAATDEIVLPVDTLRALNVYGTLRVGKLKASNLKSQSVNMTLKANKGLITVYPARAKMYGGSYSGNIQLDVSGEQMVVSMDERLLRIQASPLFKDLMDMDWIEGTANLSAKLTGKGNSVSAIKQQLNGNLGFAFLNGSIKGVNIPLKIRQAYNAIKGLPAPPDEPQQTDFTAMKGTATVSNGVVDNQDLDIQSPLLRIQGAGTADLVKENMDYLVKAKVVASLSGQGGDSLAKLKGVTIPVRIKGPFTKLGYKVELDDILKQEVKKKVKKEIKKKMEDKLKDKFKGLF